MRSRKIKAAGYATTRLTRPTLLVTTGLDPVVNADQPRALPGSMDCRIKSGNDEREKRSGLKRSRRITSRFP
jgi:hypothetical protein